MTDPQAALQSEKQTLQTRITQLENELATARATPTAASTDATVQASAGSGSEAELTSLREELAALNKASVVDLDQHFKVPSRLTFAEIR